MPSAPHTATTLAVVLWTGLGAGAALAQALPGAEQFQTKYQYGKLEEVKKVEWKASASAGLTLVTGNANLVTAAGGANAMRNDGRNKVTLDLSGVYAQTSTPVAFPNADGKIYSIEQIGSQSKPTAGFVLGRARYDRFFTDNNAFYLAAFGGLDIPASKKAIAGAQLGYSRQLLKTKRHELLAELGVDYNYTGYVTPDVAAGNPALNLNVNVASGRAFVGYNLILGANTRIEIKGEALLNLNPTTIGDRRARSADATRFVANMALTTKIWQKLSFRFATGLRYDNCPALNTALPFGSFTGMIAPETADNGVIFRCSETPDFTQSRFGSTNPSQDLTLYQARYNQKLDTLTEANLVFSFL